MRRGLAGLTLVLGVCSSASAQTLTLPTLLNAVPPEARRADANIAMELKKLSAAMVDLSVPDSPAFTVLGLTPEEIARPTTARKLAASLMNGVDRKGVLQSGVAIDTLPYLALAGHLLELSQYRARSGYLLRFFARSQVSVATAKASDVSDEAMRVAFGVRMTVMDFGDPRTDTQLDKCFNERPRLPDAPLYVIPPPPDDTATPAEVGEWLLDVARAREQEREFKTRVDSYVEAVNAAVAECRDAARKRAWNRTKWIVAVAPAWTSPTGAAGDLDSSGSGVWTTFAYGFEHLPGLENTAQVLVHARHRDNELVPDTADPKKAVVRDSQLLGVQVRAGTVDSSLAFEALFDRTTPVGGTTSTDKRMSIGYERRLAPNLWLGVAVGGGAPAAGGEKKSGFVLSSLKWGFAEGPSLAMGQ